MMSSTAQLPATNKQRVLKTNMRIRSEAHLFKKLGILLCIFGLINRLQVAGSGAHTSAGSLDTVCVEEMLHRF